MDIRLPPEEELNDFSYSADSHWENRVAMSCTMYILIHIMYTLYTIENVDHGPIINKTREAVVT